ncbi:ankyrin repeat-containing protein At5g02620-like [Vitis riparia]|uniref:ankyrin repeat-containing protein At5g02620-like n=1 Tax=Vitis riparia TaxID=96939 RepID=UPI00155A8E1B|nr:ankyrin repeat-containing protein At5g02620-like [Vitis riparia]
MADYTTSSLNLSTECNKVGAEGAREIQITNQAAADDGNLTQIIFMDPKLYRAAADGDIHVLEGHDIRDKLTPKKNTVLHVAAQFGQADFVEKILGLHSLSLLLQQPNKKGDTALHLAAREGHLTVVENLIEAAKRLQGRDLEGGAAADWKEMLRLKNEVKDTALHEAVRNHHPEVVKLLIQEDPDFAYGANAEGNTPLYIAAEWGFGDLVQMILDKCSSPAHSGIKGRTALHAAVILKDQAMTKKILEKKPDLTEALDQNEWSPLHFAAYVGCDPTIVTQLLGESDEHQYVVYLGVKYNEIGNRTALHIAASRGHVEIVKLLVSRFPDCCENVDDKGNNVLHLIMPEKKIFVTSGLSNIPQLRVRELMIQKNAEGKTPLELLHNSHLSKGVNYFPPPETTFTWILDTFVRSRRRRTPSFRVGIRPLGSLEVKEDMDNSDSKGSEEISESKESEEISELKKTMESHLIVAALIATVTFAAGFTLPGGYIQDKGDTQGMAVLSFPTNGTKGKDRDMAIAASQNFRIFVLADSIAMIFSLCAIGMYFLAAFPFFKRKVVWAFLGLGDTLTLVAMAPMVFAFVAGLEAVLHPSSFLEGATKFIILPVFILLFLVPGLLIMLTDPPDFEWKKFVGLSH